MNAMDFWRAIDWIGTDNVRLLTETLVHFLWQGCLIAMLYAAAERCLRRASAGVRYVAGVTALLLMAACLPATFWVLSSRPAESNSAPTAEMVLVLEPTPTPIERPVVEQAGGDFIPAILPIHPDTVGPTTIVPTTAADDVSAWSSMHDLFASALTWASPYASGFYVCGVCLMLLRVSLGLWGGRRLRRACVPVVDGAIFETIREQARRMGMRAMPVVAYCGRIAVPVVVGVFRPMILLPAALATGLTPVQLQAVLLHELAHVRRYDPVVNILQRLVEAFLFFHPTVWWVSRRVRAERENACDDLVLRSHCGPTQYADALLRVAELHAAGYAALPNASLAVLNGNQRELKRRLLRLLGHDEKPDVRLTPAGLVMSAVLIVSLVLAPVVWRSAATAEEKPEVTATYAVLSENSVTDSPDASAKQPVPKPVSMSAEEFGKLSLEEQRAMLVRAFERRTEHAKNIYFEEDIVIGVRGNLKESGSKPHDSRRRLRYWRMGDSFRHDTEQFDSDDLTTVSSRSSGANNAQEGVARNINFSFKDKRPPQGQVQYPVRPTADYGLVRWLTYSLEPASEPEPVEYLFPYLLEHQKEFEITAPAAGNLVQLSFPWQPSWAKQPGGKRVYLLDPTKGFLPVRCDSRYDDPPTAERRMGRTENFVVEESRLVGDVWMPTKLTEHIATSPMNISSDIRVKVTGIWCGGVKLSDLFTPFPEGAVIQADILEGATYVVDAQGYASNVKFERSWWPMPPAGWSRHAPVNPDDSWTSRILPEDRKRLVAERKAMYEKADAQKNLSDTALKVMRSSAPLDERVEAGLKLLRVYTIGSGRDYDEKAWASVVRELIQMGKPAVPKLCEELDRTERGWTLRALGFVLRGIGDPRAIPALIRAIPRLLSENGDHGLLVKDDPKLAQFMLEHDNEHIGKPGGPGFGSEHFSYGTPLREIMPALEMMTGQSHEWRELRFAHLSGSAEQQRVQRMLFVNHADRWAEWWAKNWRKYVANETDAQLDLTRQSLAEWRKRLSKVPAASPRTEFPCGPKATVEGISHNEYIRSFDESPSEGFLDLDTGRHPNPPQELVAKSPANPPSPELLAWAEREGVDLINVKLTLPGSDKTYYAFLPVGMKVWRIANDRADTIEKELRSVKKLELPAPWDGPLAQVDDQTRAYNEKLTASYLFITNNGICGLLRLRSPLSTKPIYGSPYMSGGGLEYEYIYENDAKNAGAASR